VLPYYPIGTAVAVDVPPYTLFGTVTAARKTIQWVVVVSITDAEKKHLNGKKGQILAATDRPCSPMQPEQFEKKVKGTEMYTVLLKNSSEPEFFEGKNLSPHGKVQFYDVQLDKDFSGIEVLQNVHGSQLSPWNLYQQHDWNDKAYWKEKHKFLRKQEKNKNKKGDSEISQSSPTHLLGVGELVLVMDMCKQMFRHGVIKNHREYSEGPLDERFCRGEHSPPQLDKPRQQWFLNRTDAYDVQWGDKAEQIFENVSWHRIRPLGGQAVFVAGQEVLCELSGTNEYFEAIITGVRSEDEKTADDNSVRRTASMKRALRVYSYASMKNGARAAESATKQRKKGGQIYSVRYKYAKEKGIPAGDSKVSAWRLRQREQLKQGSFCVEIDHKELNLLPERYGAAGMMSALFGSSEKLESHLEFWSCIKEQLKTMLGMQTDDEAEATARLTEKLERKDERDPKSLGWFRVAFPDCPTAWFQNTSADPKDISISRAQWCRIFNHIWQQAQVDQLWEQIRGLEDTCSLRNLLDCEKMADLPVEKAVGADPTLVRQTDKLANNLRLLRTMFELTSENKETADERDGEIDGKQNAATALERDASPRRILKNKELNNLIDNVKGQVGRAEQHILAELNSCCSGAALLNKKQFSKLLRFLQTIRCLRMETTETEDHECMLRCRRLPYQAIGLKHKRYPGDVLIFESQPDSEVVVEITLAKGMAAQAHEEIELNQTYLPAIDWEKAMQEKSIDVEGMDGSLRFSSKYCLRRNDAWMPVLRGQTISFRLPLHDEAKEMEEWKISDVDDGISVEVLGDKRPEHSFAEGGYVFVVSGQTGLGYGEARYVGDSCFVVLRGVNTKVGRLFDGQKVLLRNQQANEEMVADWGSLAKFIRHNNRQIKKRRTGNPLSNNTV
jgi:hypothetical protein